jgi:hypothetical protein
LLPSTSGWREAGYLLSVRAAAIADIRAEPESAEAECLLADERDEEPA